MKCTECGEKMRIDDCDRDSRFNYTKYFVCDSCGTACVQEVRNQKIVSEHWYHDYFSMEG